jgi:hypothetical protein
MPGNWLEWLGAVASVLTIVSFVLYLRERYMRKLHDTLMLGFLHEVKPLFESLSKRDTTTGTDWQSVIDQINNMLSRLQPPKGGLWP